MSLLNLIKAPKADVFRRAYIKRRVLGTGLFESDWLEITNDVKSFGKVTAQIDAARLFKFSFGNLKLTLNNDDGKFNPEDNDSSLWNGYLNQQRTLVKIEVGFFSRSKDDNGIWTNVELPTPAFWDDALWDDEDYVWDGDRTSTVFKGIISGDIVLSDKNEVTFTVKPLMSIFQEFPAANLTGWTSTGITASQFMGMLRDQTDGSSSFVFRPFFDDTTANWDISTTSNIFSNLNTSTAADVIDKNVWEIIEKLSEAENFVPYITRDGAFKFVSREANSADVDYEFHGAGSFSTIYGNTIKSISSYGKKPSKYYSRIQVKFNEANTSTSYYTKEATFTVSPSSNPWVLGHRTLNIDNVYIPNTATAQTIGDAIFEEYSSLKNEMTFVTTLIPQLDILDRFAVYYDPSEVTPGSLWDQFNWADDNTDTSLDLVWDASKGDAVNLAGEEFKFLSLEIDLDNFENRMTAREV